MIYFIMNFNIVIIFSLVGFKDIMDNSFHSSSFTF